MLLARRGADLVLAGRRSDKLEQMSAAIRDATGRRVLEVPTDVRKPEQARALIDRTVADLGRIDILINNAGGAREHKGLSQLTPEGWERDVQLNLSAAQYCSQAALPWMHTKFAVFFAIFGAALTLRTWRRLAAVAAFLTPMALSGVLWLYSFYAIYGAVDPEAPYGAYTRT